MAEPNPNTSSQRKEKTRLIDLTGQTFGRLTVIRRDGNHPKKRQDGKVVKGETIWLCQCECGNLSRTQGRRLTSGRTRSCGCLNREAITKHGMWHSRVYKIWDGMKSRCENPHHSAYQRYGARGITVCERWHIFENFLADMGEPPVNHSLERIDNAKDYSPDNCKWATSHEQSRNKRSNRIEEFNGKSQTRADWAQEYGLTQNMMRARLDNGWTMEQALGLAPPPKRRKPVRGKPRTGDWVACRQCQQPFYRRKTSGARLYCSHKCYCDHRFFAADHHTRNAPPRQTV